MILGGVTDQATLGGEGHDRWSDAITLVILNDLDASVLVNTDTRVCGSEVDANDITVDDGFALTAGLLYQGHEDGQQHGSDDRSHFSHDSDG